MTNSGEPPVRTFVHDSELDANPAMFQGAIAERGAYVPRTEDDTDDGIAGNRSQLLSTTR